jgi:hypothetical protein
MNEQNRLVKKVQEENEAAEKERFKDSYTYSSGNIIVHSPGSPPPVITSTDTSCSNTMISNGQTITYTYTPPPPFPIPAKV